MSKKRTILVNLFGLWAFGMLVGANVRDLLPGDPSVPSWLLLGVGVVGSFMMFGAVHKAVR
jgi:hypothetical protein